MCPKIYIAKCQKRRKARRRFQQTRLTQAMVCLGPSLSHRVRPLLVGTREPSEAAQRSLLKYDIKTSFPFFFFANLAFLSFPFMLPCPWGFSLSETSPKVDELVANFRMMMSPYTALKLKVCSSSLQSPFFPFLIHLAVFFFLFFLHHLILPTW